MNARVAHALARISFLAALAPLDSGATPVREWNFEVLLDGKPIGYHNFSLSDDAGMRHLRSEARFRVKVLGFTVYSYSHQSIELWQRDCLQRVEASTDDNGSDFVVRGDRDGQHLRLQKTGGESALPGCVMTFAYWNPAILQQQRLLNVQTGDYLEVEVKQLDTPPYPIAVGAAPARYYRLDTGERDIELWYTADYDWLGLRSTLSGGRKLHYRRLIDAPLAEAYRQ